MRFGTLFYVSTAHNQPLRDDVIKWKHLPRYRPIVRGIHWSPVNSPHKGQWRRALMFSLICAWINGWVNNREADGLRRHCAHYDVIVMSDLCLPLPTTLIGVMNIQNAADIMTFHSLCGGHKSVYITTFRVQSIFVFDAAPFRCSIIKIYTYKTAV